MLMHIKEMNRYSLKYCCKDCMRGNTGKGRDENRRHIKRAQRQKWQSEVRNILKDYSE